MRARVLHIGRLAEDVVVEHHGGVGGDQRWHPDRAHAITVRLLARQPLTM
jgi:hypothetical protein